MGARVHHPGSDRIDRLAAASAINLGLVFNTMAGGLALTAVVARAATSSGLAARRD